MKTEVSNKKGADPMDEQEEVNWPVVIPILIVMVGLIAAFYFMY
ncbi:hypothetical protein [Marivirga aurantiaca]|nr:hypothetical protein [Marivirga aurantiaca]